MGVGWGGVCACVPKHTQGEGEEQGEEREGNRSTLEQEGTLEPTNSIFILPVITQGSEKLSVLPNTTQQVRRPVGTEHRTFELLDSRRFTTHSGC